MECAVSFWGFNEVLWHLINNQRLCWFLKPCWWTGGTVNAADQCFLSSFNGIMPLNNEMAHFSPTTASLLYPLCSSMCINSLRCFSSLRSTAPAFLFSVSAVHWGLWRLFGLVLVLCWGVWACTDTGVKSGLSCFKLAPVWPEQMRGLFLHDGSIADGVPVGSVSRLYVERLLRTDTLTKYNNTGQNNYTTALLVL